jgi:tetratricopeptide (TPR) repeat protein
MLTDGHILSLTYSARQKLQQGNWVGALNIYNDILRQRPEHKETYVELARLYLDREDISSAWKVLQKAIRIAPGDSEVNFVMGVVKYIEGDFEGALECYRKVEENDGLDCNLAVNIALACEVLGWSQQALRYMEYAISRGEPNWRSFEFIVDLYKRSGKLEAAVKAAQAASMRFQEVPEVHLVLARLYQRVGNEIGALVQYEAAAARAANSTEVLSEVAEFYLSSDRYMEAVPLLEKLSATETEAGPYHNVLAQCYAAIGQEEKANEVMRNAARKRLRNASGKSIKRVSQSVEEE